MQLEQRLVILYVFFWLIRIRGCVRRGRQPRLRGPEWFFNVHVAPGFYEGPGRRLLRAYWVRMMIPFAVDIPMTVAIFVTGHLVLLSWLILGVATLIHLNHVWSVDLAERQARPFAVAEAEPAVARVAVSLQTRRLRDYLNPRLEWAIALLSVAAMAALVRYYAGVGAHHDLRLVFGVPLLLTYLQAGLLVVKRLVVAWRRPIPQDYAAEYLEVSEQTRRYYLLMCDWNRLAAAIAMLMWPIQLGLSPTAVKAMATGWFAVWIVQGSAATVWIEIKRQQLTSLALRARPVTLPDFLHQAERARWPICYEPSAPMLMLKGARGYSLNLANGLAQVSAAYLAGFAILIFVLRMKP